jgi:hypothetical protein
MLLYNINLLDYCQASWGTYIRLAIEESEVLVQFEVVVVVGKTLCPF